MYESGNGINAQNQLAAVKSSCQLACIHTTPISKAGCGDSAKNQCLLPKVTGTSATGENENILLMFYRNMCASETRITQILVWNVQSPKKSQQKKQTNKTDLLNIFPLENSTELVLSVLRHSGSVMLSSLVLSLFVSHFCTYISSPATQKKCKMHFGG